MLSKKEITKYSEIFKALGNPLRLQILCGLCNKENCNVSKMVEHLGVSQSRVSQQLSILKNAGLVKTERRGKEICYFLSDQKIKKILDVIKK